MLELLIVSPLLLFLTFAGVQYWAILAQHQMAGHLMHRSLARMQIEGLLSLKEESRLRADLRAIGCESVTLQGDLESGGGAAVLRPGEVRLTVACRPALQPLLVGRLIGVPEAGPDPVIRVGGRMTSEHVAP